MKSERNLASRILTFSLLIAVSCSVVFSCIVNISFDKTFVKTSNYQVKSTNYSSSGSISYPKIEAFFYNSTYFKISDLSERKKKSTQVKISEKFENKSHLRLNFSLPQKETLDFCFLRSRRTCPPEVPLS